ncbi:ribulokinase [Clostridium estertheticum]|uniref:ribulokinase n=1 Tax=Clostridium estertheticum TaxID=238834 RepID=UPI0013E906FE|nr:ribulokinase [Clostridium estertheticum]MBZ9686039.1 ribulokinase [Clostridium estertheticum]
MKSKKYSIGLDYGTQSGRAVLVEIKSGDEIATAIMAYSHGVIDEYLPGTDIKLQLDWALQDPDDYLEVLYNTVPRLLEVSKVRVEDIIGIGIDFTACTMMPVAKDGQVLCQKDEYRKNPHAWVKLWKHHAAQRQANKLNEIAEMRKEEFMQYYAGKMSSEWLMPKIYQILEEAPEIYEVTDRFMEASDWITMKLTGVDIRNTCTAGYKGLWNKKSGYPNKFFFKAVDSRLENIIEDKLNAEIRPIGSKAGSLISAMAKKMGLREGIAVAVGNVDAHVAVPAVNIVEEGKMLMVMGTSTCHLVLGKEEKFIEGVCGVVADGIIQNYYGYEAGQAAVGDIFQWFVANAMPKAYFEEAENKGIDIYCLLEEKAARLKPGQSGLLALDWWNGSRSVLMDSDLTGIILGYNILTKPEEVYRALVEATAFGTNRIVEAFNNGGVEIKELYACGGLAEKNKMLMQIYADVTNMEIRISDSAQTPALGAAIFGAVAAGKENGGYDTIFDAAKNMARLKENVYKPIASNVQIYKKLYIEYRKLHDYFGLGENNVMKTLKNLKKDTLD